MIDSIAWREHVPTRKVISYDASIPTGQRFMTSGDAQRHEHINKQAHTLVVSCGYLLLSLAARHVLNIPSVLQTHVAWDMRYLQQNVKFILLPQATGAASSRGSRLRRRSARTREPCFVLQFLQSPSCTQQKPAVSRPTSRRRRRKQVSPSTDWLGSCFGGRQLANQ